MISPLFPGHVHGGSQRTLEAVVRYLGSQGHSVTVYGMRREDNTEPFWVTPNVKAMPVLRFQFEEAVPR